MKRYIFILSTIFCLVTGCVSSDETYYNNKDYNNQTSEQIEQYQKESSFNTDEFIWEEFRQ